MAKKDDPASKVPYQQAAQVRQALAERELAEAYGNDERVRAADKVLAELGVKPTQRQDKVDDDGPKGRQAPAKQTAADAGKK